MTSQNEIIAAIDDRGSGVIPSALPRLRQRPSLQRGFAKGELRAGAPGYNPG